MSEFLFGDLTDWIEGVIDALGYVGVTLLVVLENVFPPIPSEVVLPAAGLYAQRNGGAGPLAMMAASTTSGSVIGALMLYALTARIGSERVRAFVVRRGRWLGVTDDDLRRAEAWFDRRGELAVLVCRCVPLVRSLVSVPAGMRRMPPVRFVAYTAAGSAVWNVALITLGYAASSYQDRIEVALGYVQYLVVGAAVAGLAWFVWRRRSSSHEQEHHDQTGEQTDRGRQDA